jgi:hypothetical protein
VWANRASPSGDERGIKIRRSTDGGTTWLEPQYVLLNQPPFIVWFVRVIAASGNNMYLALTRYVSGYVQTFLTRSQDAGATWDSVRQVTFGTIAFGSWDIAASDRGVHIVYEQNTLPSRGEIGIFSSTDRGETWNSGQILSTIDAFTGWEPQVAADDSGNVFACWQDAKYGSTGFGGTVLLRRSSDGGRTWFPETRIHDFPAAIRSTLGIDEHQIYVAWDDERLGGRFHRIRFACSSDFGSNWSGDFVVGDTLDNNIDPAIYASASRVFLAWSSYLLSPSQAYVFFRNGTMQLTSVVEVIAQNVKGSFVLRDVYPNPFNSSITVPLELRESQHLRLSVSDMLGREIIVLFDGNMSAGIHSWTLSGEQYSSGVYFLHLQTKGRREVRQILLLK